MFFIKNINQLIKDPHDKLYNLVDPITLKKSQKIVKEVLTKLFEFKNSNVGFKKSIINILIDDWVRFVCDGVISEIYDKNQSRAGKPPPRRP